MAQLPDYVSMWLFAAVFWKHKVLAEWMQLPAGAVWDQGEPTCRSLSVHWSSCVVAGHVSEVSALRLVKKALLVRALLLFAINMHAVAASGL